MKTCLKCGKKFSVLQQNTYFSLCEHCYQHIIDLYGDTSIYRFICVEELKTILKAKVLIFKTPSSWDDTLEDYFYRIVNEMRVQRLLDPVFIRDILSSRDGCYFQCWTITPESYFFWNTYGTIRIEAKIRDFFDMGIRAVPILYDSFPRMEQISFFRNPNGNKESDLLILDENRDTHLTDKMIYNQHIFVSIMNFMTEYRTYFRKMPIEISSIFKDVKYEIENEVRLILEYQQNPLYKEYKDAHDKYVTKVHVKYDDFSDPLETDMKKDISWSFKDNPKLIQSVLCHPQMEEKEVGGIFDFMKSINMDQLFLGKSKLFGFPYSMYAQRK
ncbi:MAG: hypothetical protein IJ682_04325 [Lachnospiraceae bacterium]|nr:hypothetical protein [Lachnospiraceae bacterium]